MNLEVMILNILENGNKSGYEIMKTLEKETGWKPSPGSVYPVLKGLKNEGFVNFKNEGKSKVYSLTKEGKKQTGLIKKRRDEFSKQILRNLEVYGRLMGEKNKGIVRTIIDVIRTGKVPFGNATEEVFELRRLLFGFVKENKVKKNDMKIKTILQKTIKELKKI